MNATKVIAIESHDRSSTVFLQTSRRAASIAEPTAARRLSSRTLVARWHGIMPDTRVARCLRVRTAVRADNNSSPRRRLA